MRWTTCSAAGAAGAPPCLARFSCSNALSRWLSLSFALTCLRDPTFDRCSVSNREDGQSIRHLRSDDMEIWARNLKMIRNACVIEEWVFLFDYSIEENKNGNKKIADTISSITVQKKKRDRGCFAFISRWYCTKKKKESEEIPFKTDLLTVRLNVEQCRLY